MAETTIEWADFTFNPWTGCTKQGRADARVLNRAAADMAREAKAVAFPLDDTEGGQ
jgi:protein gp37